MKLNQHELIADFYNPFDDGNADESYTSLGGDSGKASNLRRHGAGGYLRVKAWRSLMLGGARFAFEDIPQMYLQFFFSSQLPLTENGDLPMTIKVSLLVSLIAGVGGLLLAFKDFWDTWNEQWVEEPAAPGLFSSRGGRVCSGVVCCCVIYAVIHYQLPSFDCRAGLELAWSQDKIYT